MQDGQMLLPQDLAVPLVQALQVGFFHEEDHIGPAQHSLGDGDAGARLSATGSNLELRAACEDFFRRQTAPPVPAADEQNFYSGWVSHAACKSFRSWEWRPVPLRGPDMGMGRGSPCC